ncbi:MAG TPA: HAD-IIB family hydrolase, partial [Candidatus Obscuribacterales bacterium]
MRYLALACDYDGTLATHGKVDDETVSALSKFAASGRKLLLVTGRQLDDLLDISPQIDLFDRVVAENGGVLYRPATKEEKLLAEPPSEQFVNNLRLHGVQPISVGRCIVATWVPHETTVVKVIREMGLELQVIFNKGAVMILPAGVNKASGLRAALAELGLSKHNVVSVGDAENDHAMLKYSECGVAVRNSLPSLIERADFATLNDHGAGVSELIDLILKSDLQEVSATICRHDIPLGTTSDGTIKCLRPFGTGLLLAGPSGSGKSTTALGIIERLIEAGYQICLIDPEGDYQSVPGAVTLGNAQKAPTIDEIMQLLKKPKENAVVNLLALPLDDRPPFFEKLLPHLQDLRTQKGRPHWLIVDEAHHLLPPLIGPPSPALMRVSGSTMLITVHPDQVSKAVLSSLDVVVAVGKDQQATMQNFSRLAGTPISDGANGGNDEAGNVLAWFKATDSGPMSLQVLPTRSERRRHQRKYAEGDLGGESFTFQGPEAKLKLRAQNLSIFLQMAEGVDDETWNFHLRRGDYSRWFRSAIKDEGLAADAEAVEKDERLD